MQKSKVPTSSCAYFVSDARLGLGKELNMTPDQYNMTLTIFFITYSIFGDPKIVDSKLID